MSKRELVLIAMDFALTAALLISAVVNFRDSSYTQSGVTGALGIIYVFITYIKIMKLTKPVS